MSKLIKRLDTLKTTALDALLGFYEPQLHTFCAKAEDLGLKHRVCITSSCYSLLTLTLANSGIVYDHLISFNEDDAVPEEGKQTGQIGASSEGDNEDNNSLPDHAASKQHIVSIRQVLKTILDSPWRDDDFFQAPLLLYTILKVDHNGGLIQQHAAKISVLIAKILEARPHRHYGLQQEHSDYIIYQICKVVALLHEHVQQPSSILPPTALPHNATSEIFWALLRCAEGKWAGKWA
jgi:hypothetical protein